MNKYIFKAIVFVFMIVLIAIGVSPFLINVNKQDNSPNIATVNSAFSASVVPEGEIKTTDSGYFHSGVVINDGKYDHLYTWGRNDEGQLGLGDKNNRNVPTEVFFDIDGVVGSEDIIIKDLYMDTWATAVVINDGVNDHLYVWGAFNENVPNEALLTSLELGVVSVNDVSFGWGSFFAITEDRNGVESLYVWGENSKGQLGLGINNSNIEIPVKLDIGASVTGYKNIEVSDEFYSVIVTTNKGDELYIWGDNEYGRLGIGDSDLQKIVLTPMIVDFTPEDDETTSLGDITSLDLGANHASAVINNNGTDELYMWGSNDYGELGFPPIDADPDTHELFVWYDTPTKIEIKDFDNEDYWRQMTITDVKAGAANTLVSTIEDGKSHVYVTGVGQTGVIGNGSNNSQETFLDITSFIPNFEDGDEIYSIQLGFANPSIVVSNGENNTLYSWGRNDDGQLGTGNNDKQSNVITKVLSVKPPVKSITENILFWPIITLQVSGIILITLIFITLACQSWAKSQSQ